MEKTSESSKPLSVAIYIRVSSEEQAERGDSIRDQRERGLSYIREHKNMVLKDIYLDDGVSGQKIDRNDFTRLMTHVEQGLIDLIIFTKLDRWFRSLRHYLNTQAVLEKHHAAWTAIDQPYFDTSTPYGRAFVAQSMTFAELEAQNGGIRVCDVFRSKVSHGEVITGKVPRGYRIVDKRMELSEEAPAVYDAIMHFLNHQSMHQAVCYLKEQYGIIMTPQNFKQSLLCNEKITGRYRNNEHYCPRLISDDTYVKIQRILRKNCNIKSSQKYPYLFSGLLICNECGRKLSGCQIHVLARRKGGERIRYQYPAYQCKQNSSHKKCENKGEIRENRIEACLLKQMKEQLNNDTAEFETGTKKEKNISTKKSQLQKKIKRLKDLYLNEVISLEEYKEDRNRLDDQLIRLLKESPPQKNPDGFKEPFFHDFEQLYHHLDLEQKRLFWRSIISEIRVSKSTNRQREFTIIFL